MEDTQMMTGLSPEIMEMLNAPLDPSVIQVNDFNNKKPDFEYIDRDTVIAQANRIFGFDGWGYRVVGPVTFTRTPDVMRQNRTTGKMEKVGQGFYMALVSVAVRGVGTRDHVGTWNIANENPDSHDTAAAGAVTKALKRALRTFGPQFGLELRSTTGGRSGHGTGARADATPIKKGGARIAKEWADAREIKVPELCQLMNINSLGDREISQFMESRSLDDPEKLPDVLDQLAAKAA